MLFLTTQLRRAIEWFFVLQIKGGQMLWKKIKI